MRDVTRTSVLAFVSSVRSPLTSSYLGGLKGDSGPRPAGPQDPPLVWIMRCGKRGPRSVGARGPSWLWIMRCGKRGP